VSNTLSASGDLGQLDWKVETSVHGDLNLGSGLDEVVSLVVSGLQDTVVLPFSAAAFDRPVLSDLERPVVVNNDLYFRVNDLDVSIVATLTFKVDVTSDECDLAEENIGTVLIAANTLLSEVIAEATARAADRKRRQQHFDAIASGPLGSFLGPELMAILHDDMLGSNGNGASRSTRSPEFTL